MRWSGQQVLDTGVGESAALPGMRGLLRTVRTPEFAGTVFHEVEARSALNRVPGPSALPFEWTVNPYRGCSHACVYCLAGPTRVLLPDGRTRPISRLRVGDVVLGTEPAGAEGDGRRYVPTVVLAHWSTTKPAHRLRLRGGTEIVASGEHRFLTDRGWRHVSGGWCRSGRRPRLRPGGALLGPGPGGPPAGHDGEHGAERGAEYRAGYLCGLVDGDGPRAFPSPRLELEVLGRAHHFLSRFPVRPAPVAATVEPGRVPPGRGLAALTDFLRHPIDPDDDWCAGYLAGVLDARGEAGPAGGFVVRHPDDAVLGRVAGALHRLGFRFAVTRGERGVGIGPAGGSGELLRLLRVVDPAVTRDRGLTGAAVEAVAGMEVESVVDLGGELAMYDITTGTGDFVAEGVVSHNCFARNTHTYLDLDAGADFDSQIVVKVNVARVLDRELRSPRWTREPVAMGTNTDPYQRAEGRYRLMPGVIDALARSGTPFSVLTKGTVLTRDLPRLVAAAADVPVGLGVSIALLDRPLQERLEPGTPSPAARLDMVRRIADAGLACGVMVAPVLPLLTDSPEALDALLARIAAAGASGATVMALHLRPGTREWFTAWLAREHPALVPRYERLYRRGAYVDPAYRRALAERVAPLLRRHGLVTGAGTLRGRTAPEGDGAVDPPGEQLSLL
ncbi:intein-containing Rv2578c family radical SAM protein [Pseudonocardia humida]|uniref:Intein-containing Rv2578c family radical SAM protein n=1 Tax=Pseudonocardia humida TaxID=2800819 RepID=A0ABT1A6W0_9PSEU|nr:intein-containing Rv2578c family radical SAM protein [Pseudonocardia humida]MCO1658733.1 intein-containing Rv2578c family radical SAM protein [Pseudonocardia humida]